MTIKIHFILLFLICISNVYSHVDIKKYEADTTFILQKSDSCNLPNGFSLVDIYPQPFGYVSNYKFGIPDSSKVSVSVLDENLDTVKFIGATSLHKGYYVFKWDRKNSDMKSVKAGIYYIIVQADRSIIAKQSTEMYFKGIIRVLVID
jgi:hypothetical protein